MSQRGTTMRHTGYDPRGVNHMWRTAPFLFVLVVLPLGAQPSLPLLDKLSVTPPSASLQSTVRGAPQAVPSSAHVIVVNTHSGHYAIAQASTDGSFEIPLYAAPGDSILVKSDPGGAMAARILQLPQVIDHALSDLTSLHGTIVRAPDGLTSPNAFVESGRSVTFLPYWTMNGTIDRLAAAPGEGLIIDATYIVYTTVPDGVTARLNANATLIALSRADGSGALDQNTYCSTLPTPTGLPIERTSHGPTSLSFGKTVPLQREGDRLRATFQLAMALPADLPPGFYRPVLRVQSNEVVGAQPQNIAVTTFLGNAGRRQDSAAYLPVVKIGDPAAPRIEWTLLANTIVEGGRGARAIEDRGRFGIVPRISTASDHFIVPRVDRRTGAVHRYNIEPYALTIGLADRGAPISPPLPFRFPSGGLTATVRRPNGAVTTIGPVPFRQIALVGPSRADGNSMEGGGHITDPVRLTTLDPRFDLAFEQEGRHVITLEGTIEDAWGNVWRGRGTYEIDVAASLLIESMTIPGTPFEARDVIARGVQLVPPVPAEVEIRVRHAPRSRTDSMIDETIVVLANRFGHAHVRPMRLDEPGEYRVDIFATHRDAEGRLWAGAQTFASVVADRSPGIVANGMRGVDDQPENRQQWFSRAQIGIPPGRGHVPFAFRSGDVMWLQDNDACIPAITVQDVDGTLSPILRPLFATIMPPAAFDKFASIGEIPLQSIGTTYEPHIDPARADVWAYSYRSVQRPHIRIREEISDHSSPAPYWRFNDLYALQSGNGGQGDLPNDFKFQFGGAVLRGPALPTPRYAIYGSLFVLVPNDDPGGGTRTLPPFQGNGGGPSGGPLFTLKGKGIDLFFHPTAVRAGTILTKGQPVSFSGYSAPTLPSKIEIAVTAPSGKQRTIQGEANRVGYFYDPSQDFMADEAGLWRAKVKITFDGVTSAGRVSAPFPSGDILGSREGELAFYVVENGAEQLDLAPMPAFINPTDRPITFRLLPPPDLTDVSTHYTVTMPGFLLEEGSNALEYTYDAFQLAESFPNLDLREGHGPLAGIDIITFSFLLSGTDAQGVRRHFARQIALVGEALHMPEQQPFTKRRAVR